MHPSLRLILGLGLGLMLWPATAYAVESAPTQRLPNPIVAVIDVQRILQESMAAKSVQGQLEAKRAKFQTEIEAEENDLRQAEKNLTDSRGKISADTYTDRDQQLRQRFLDEERNVQTRRKSLDDAFTNSMNTVRAGFMEIVDTVAHAHGVNLVIVKQQTLWIAPELDVTNEVLQKLNEKMPSVTVTMPPESKDKPKTKS